MFFFFKQKTAYEMRMSDWISDVCSSDLPTLYLEHTERPENLDPAGGTRRPLRGSHDRHHEGRAIQSGFPGDQPEQQDSCDHRSGWAWRCDVHAVRIRCNPHLSRKKAPKPPKIGRENA